jgi:hypothetical protein
MGGDELLTASAESNFVMEPLATETSDRGAQICAAAGLT